MSRFIRVVPEWCAALSLNELADADCFPSSHPCRGFCCPAFWQLRPLVVLVVSYYVILIDGTIGSITDTPQGISPLCISELAVAGAQQVLRLFGFWPSSQTRFARHRMCCSQCTGRPALFASYSPLLSAPTTIRHHHPRLYCPVPFPGCSEEVPHCLTVRACSDRLGQDRRSTSKVRTWFLVL